jgi:hypothetical protein
MKCEICNKTFNRIQSLGSHFVQLHKISKEEYYLKYLTKSIPRHLCGICGNPTRFQNLIVGYGRFCSGVCAGKANKFRSEKDRRKISIATKLAMSREDVKQKHLDAVRKPKSEETHQKMSKKAKMRCTDEWKKRLYTDVRNKKISDSKKLYWKTHPEERKRIMDIWKKRSETSLEIKMYKFLADSGIRFEKRYELDQKQYDAYLPDYNVIIEFDGDFWHKQTLYECKYNFQTFNFYNDQRKNEIARKHNIPLFRIHESDPPEKILECLNPKKIV